MDDVGREVVLAVADENLLAGDAEVLSLGHRLGPHARQIRAGLRLGEQHRAGPRAGNQLRQIVRPHAHVTVLKQKLRSRLRKQRADRERHVGAAPDLADGGRQQAGQILSSIFRWKPQAVPAAIDEPPIGAGEAVRNAHRAVLEHASLPIAGGVQRRQHFGGEASRLVEHGVDQIVGRLRVARQFAHRLKIGELPHRESHVGERRGINCHGTDLREGGEVSVGRQLIVQQTRAPDNRIASLRDISNQWRRGSGGEIAQVSGKGPISFDYMHEKPVADQADHVLVPDEQIFRDRCSQYSDLHDQRPMLKLVCLPVPVVRLVHQAFFGGEVRERVFDQQVHSPFEQSDVPRGVGRIEQVADEGDELAMFLIQLRHQP